MGGYLSELLGADPGTGVAVGVVHHGVKRLVHPLRLQQHTDTHNRGRGKHQYRATVGRAGGETTDTREARDRSTLDMSTPFKVY